MEDPMDAEEKSEASQPAATTREETTERILDAAEDLFATRRPDTVTVRDVAASAGVTHALVHNYIGSKDDLLNAVIKRMEPSRGEVIRESPTFRQAIEDLAPDVLETKLHSRMMVRSAMDGVEYVSLKERLANGQALVGLARASLETAEPAPRCAGVDPRMAVASVIAFTYGWVALENWLPHICDLQDEDPEEIQAQVTQIAGCIADLIFPAEQD
jgi:AcrR family transcriptional regulator